MNLRGGVKFPTGGDARATSTSPRAEALILSVWKQDPGETPEPTVIVRMVEGSGQARPPIRMDL